MKIGVLGTGIVGRAHAARLADLGHAVLVGTRDVEASLAAGGNEMMGLAPLSEWSRAHPEVTLVPFAKAAADGEIVVNALNGAACVPVLSLLAAELAGKVLVDISNPLDYSAGMPPTLSVSNTDSLGEQIQRTLPDTKVVKTLNTVNAMIQVDPRSLADGDHDCFVSADDEGAKECVTGMLRDWYGWKNVIDLGDMSTARGPEMYMPLWIRLWAPIQTPKFNIKVVSG